VSVILGAVDALRDLMPLATGMVVDDSAAEPFKLSPNRLYAWARRAAPQRTDEAGGLPGRWDEADLQVRVLYTVASKGESRTLTADRGVSEALDAALDLMTAAVATNRRHPLWWDAYVSNVLPDAARSMAIRGIAIDVTLRLNPPSAAGGSGS
jgi:hypothetical protein